MVISCDKSENNPDLASSRAAETVQGPAPPAETLPPGTPASAGRDLAGPGGTATLADRPFGRRVAAAILDLAVLAALYVIISLIVGPTSPAIGLAKVHLAGFTITVGSHVLSIGLHGAWAVLYAIVLLPGYYFALETLAGQTAGKALLGLRVLRTDGERATAGSIALRTLLRLFDWLPALYLAGFIVMLGTGRRRRQRLGDLAGETVVVRAARASRSLALTATCLAVVILAAAGLSAYRLASPAGSQTFRRHGISFRYPTGWGQGRSTSADHSSNLLWNLAVGPGGGQDLVIISSYRLTKEVGTGNLGTAAGEVRHLIQGSLRRHGGDILSGPQQITVGGMPGFRIQVGTYLPDGTPIQSILSFAFNGTTEYLINCQTTRARTAAIAAGCRQVVRTFRTTASAAAPDATAPAARSTLPPPPLSAAQRRIGLRLLQEQMNRTVEAGGRNASQNPGFTASTLRALPGQARDTRPAAAGYGPARHLGMRPVPAGRQVLCRGGTSV
jgi:uncharacterized RDD family membrane protein YckC